MTAPKVEVADIEAEIDGLYQQPLASFTEGRNEVAARLKAAGDRDGAARVKALPKPSGSAWAVNQVSWRHGKPLQRLYEASDRLREVQGGRASADDVREAMRERREALAAVTRAAEALLTEAGQGTSDAVMRRVSTTLEALAALPETRPRAGRLAEDLSPPGFEALAALAFAAPAEPARRPEPVAEKPKPAAKADKPGRAKKSEDKEDAAAAAARQAVAEAAEAVAGRRREAEETSAAEAEAAARAERARFEAAAARAALDQARQELERAKKRLTAAEGEEEEAAAAATAARKEAREAAGRLGKAEQALQKAEERARRSGAFA